MLNDATDPGIHGRGSAKFGFTDGKDARRHGPASVLLYFVVTFAWTWSLWWSAAAFAHLPGTLLFITGGLGPLLGAAWLVSRGDHAYRREFLRRVWSPRRIPIRSWLALVAVAVGPAVLGAGLAGVAGATATVPDFSVGSVGVVVVFALMAGLVEEPGWRGAASDLWQVGTRPVCAAVGIAAFWALWHLPLYFIEGTYQHGLEFGSVRFWLTNLVLVELGVLFVWLTNSAGGRILVAVLAHAGFNIAAGLVPRSTMGDVIAFFVVSATAVTVITMTRGCLSFERARSRKRPPGRSEGRARLRWPSRREGS